MEKLYAFIGDATHQDSPDGLNQFTVIADDAPAEIVEEAMEDSEDAIVRTVDRATMDSIAKSIEEHRDTHGMGDGYLLDLAGDYIVCLEEAE
jgi:hypothetical protein